MNKRTVLLASCTMAIAVILGAFGAHALKTRLGPEALATWKTGVEYQFYHGLGMLLVAALGVQLTERAQRWISNFFLTGILLFSGSLYVLSTKELTGMVGMAKLIGPITPLGGLCFIAGWITLFITAWRRPVQG